MNPLSFLDGYKTFIGGLLLLAVGIGGLVLGRVDGATATALIGNAFAVWGVGGKLESIVQNAVKAQVQAKVPAKVKK